MISYERLRDVKGGERRTAELQLTLGNLARVDEKGNTVIYPGEYTLTLDEPTQSEIKVVLEGEETILDEWPQPPKRN